MAKRSKKQRNATEEEKALARFNIGYRRVAGHPMFSPLAYRAHIQQEGCPSRAWAVGHRSGRISVNIMTPASQAEWAYIIAHCLLHLGMGHFNEEKEHPYEWNVACDLVVARFLAEFKLGRSPQNVSSPGIGAGQTEESLYEHFVRQGIPEHFRYSGTGIPGQPDMIWESESRRYSRVISGQREPEWETLFGTGLRNAVTQAVDVAAGQAESMYIQGPRKQNSTAERARAWFINHFPLLGALAATFDIIEDVRPCQRMHISVAAVNCETKEVYINPAAGLTEAECRFVMAHELLHVGLRHHARCEGRDPYYWNVACDYVINGWLIEMGVGDIPQFGGLYDPAFKNESAEAIYDRIVNDIRLYRRLSTLRGKELCDMLEPATRDWWTTGAGVSLDDFYRRCLAQGLIYHEQVGRGYLPSGLVEEIRALAQPPIPWDVELAQWFDAYFKPLEKIRSYARPSRRQSATPDIPRPRWVAPPESEAGRTFGVVLDTSGSMERSLLAKALGAIASYSMAHDVPAVRVVFCDAVPYDQGYMPPEAIADRVRVKGRGGTVLQPAVNLLEKAEDFPKDGPILIITDGWCDRLRIRHEHAFLIPDGHYLPFRPVGKVFKIS